MGAPLIVLVPGAGGSAWYWHRVVPLLQAGGRRAVAVDLPGNDPDAALLDSVDRVVSAARDGGEVVLVGQSFGGFSASAAVPRLEVRELVLVNAMIPLPGESGAQWWKAVGQRAARREAEAAAGRDPDAGFSLETVFFHDLSPQLVAAALEHEREQAERAFNDPWPLEAWPEVATRVLVGDDDRLFPPEMQRRVAQERLGLPVQTLPGGHLNALSRPEELAAAILSGSAD
ncbi:alpha/beta fold hydrolase [Aeromicrobium sp. CTD01-1L150]|uniref:alpha/beta fold hydrolase n=1 Tax=Aeromicrobium sp. CTD01-1L150 TaxID=3341830 RepID=UPI0035BEBAF2